MTIEVNGTPRDVAEDTTVADLVADVVPGEPTGTAVALDGEVVPRADWASTVLHRGARVEVLRAVQGGNR